MPTPPTDEATPPVKCPLCSSAFVRIWEAGQTAKYTCGTEWCLKEHKPYGVGVVCGMKLHAANARLLAVKQAADGLLKIAKDARNELQEIEMNGDLSRCCVPLPELVQTLGDRMVAVDTALAACKEQEAGE
jgi:hypothetical protein